MKSIILLLIGVTLVAAQRPPGQKDFAIDFLVDNILNPLLQGIQTNGINYLLGSLLGLLGKRDLSLASVQQLVQQGLQTLAGLIQNLINNLPRDFATDFLIDNILNPLLQGIQTNGINYLLGSLLGLLGK